MSIRVVLGEDSFLAREAIAGVLERAEGIELVADCSDLESLRAAIEDDPKNPKLIQTVWGGGYKFAGAVEEL